jgi:Uma2 family endonuclease
MEGMFNSKGVRSFFSTIARRQQRPSILYHTACLPDIEGFHSSKERHSSCAQAGHRGIGYRGDTLQAVVRTFQTYLDRIAKEVNGAERFGWREGERLGVASGDSSFERLKQPHCAHLKLVWQFGCDSRSGRRWSLLTGETISSKATTRWPLTWRMTSVRRAARTNAASEAATLRLTRGGASARTATPPHGPPRHPMRCSRIPTGAFMTVLEEKTYTTQDFLDDPGLAGYELVDGHLRERPVSKRSSAVGGKIFWLLLSQALKTREASVYPSDLGYACFPDSATRLRFADVSLIRSSRNAEAGDDPGFMPIPADLVVEVLSPNDVIRNIDEKIDDYLKAGFGIVWVVSVHWRTVTIYRGDGSIQLISEHGEITGESALPSFRCKVGEFFDV